VSPRTQTHPLNDTRMWRRVVARTHPDTGRDHELFIWTGMVKDAVCGENRREAWPEDFTVHSLRCIDRTVRRERLCRRFAPRPPRHHKRHSGDKRDGHDQEHPGGGRGCCLDLGGGVRGDLPRRLELLEAGVSDPRDREGDRVDRESDRDVREEGDERRAETERRAEQLREAWRQRHPEREDEKEQP
jgi:hypothetical protein